jgi:hypothetical protein
MTENNNSKNEKENTMMKIYLHGAGRGANGQLVLVPTSVVVAGPLNDLNMFRRIERWLWSQGYYNFTNISLDW